MTCVEPQSLAEMQAAHKARRARMYAAATDGQKKQETTSRLKSAKPKTYWRPYIMTCTPLLKRVLLKYEINAAVEGESRICNAILDVVEKVSGVSQRLITSQSRDSVATFLRHVYFYLCKKHAGRSYPRIGKQCGGRHHTTVISGVRKVARAVKVGSPDVIELIEKVEAYLGFSSEGLGTPG
jgi:hypothetical protein